jgi:hypothetical protein
MVTSAAAAYVEKRKNMGAFACADVMAGAPNQKMVSVCAFAINDIEKTRKNNMKRLHNIIK